MLAACRDYRDHQSALSHRLYLCNLCDEQQGSDRGHLGGPNELNLAAIVSGLGAIVTDTRQACPLDGWAGLEWEVRRRG